MKKILIILCFMVFVLVGCNTTVSDPDIKVYTRDTTSGTRDGFFTVIEFSEAIKDNSVLVEGYVEVVGNGDMINALKNDQYGIGYISLSSYETSGLKGLTYQSVSATIDNVNNSTYQLKRTFNYVIRETFDSEALEQLVLAFIAYMGTVEGKATILNSDGIVAIEATDPSWNDIKGDFPIVEEDNSGITIRFAGSTSVEKVARALSTDFSLKAGNFQTQHNHTGSGDGHKRTQGSEKDGANKADVGFASREFHLTGSEAMNEGTYGRICADAIVVVVSPTNALSNITKAMLNDIYRGNITKWSAVE